MYLFMELQSEDEQLTVFIDKFPRIRQDCGSE